MLIVCKKMSDHVAELYHLPNHLQRRSTENNQSNLYRVVFGNVFIYSWKSNEYYLCNKIIYKTKWNLSSDDFIILVA